MQNQTQAIFFITLFGTFLGVLLFASILTLLFFYQQKRQIQEKEMLRLREEFNQEVLRSQLEIQDATMKSIAQELHDNIGQSLSVIQLWMSAAPIAASHEAYEGIQSTRELLHRVIHEMADLTKNLHTDRIADIGLAEAIRFDISSLRKAGFVKIMLEIEGDEYQISEQKSVFIFRMYQEIMNNILKHAQAAHTVVSINFSDKNHFVMKITDDGIGFNLQNMIQRSTGSSGLGLKNMRNRTYLIGGSLEIKSEPGKGTGILVSVPVK